MKERGEQRPWDWKLTEWSQKALGASGVLAAAAIGAIAIGINRKDLIFLQLGLNVAALAIPATLVLGVVQAIGAVYRARHGITRPPKQI